MRFIAQYPIYKNLPQCTNWLSFLLSLPSVPVLWPPFLRSFHLAPCPVRPTHARHCRQSIAETSHPTPWTTSSSAFLSRTPTHIPLSHQHPQQPLCSCQTLSCKQQQFDRQHSLPEGCAAANRLLKGVISADLTSTGERRTGVVIRETLTIRAHMTQNNEWVGALVAMAVQTQTAFCCLGSVGVGVFKAKCWSENW